MYRVLLFISVFLCINGQCVTWTARAGWPVQTLGAELLRVRMHTYVNACKH